MAPPFRRAPRVEQRALKITLHGALQSRVHKIQSLGMLQTFSSLDNYISCEEKKPEQKIFIFLGEIVISKSAGKKKQKFLVPVMK